MYRVGPYEFTATDARRTFVHLDALWDHAVRTLPRVPPAALAAGWHVAQAVGDLTGHAPATPPPEDPAVVMAALTVAGRAAEQAVADGRWAEDEIAAHLATAWVGIRAVGDELRATSAIVTGGPVGRVAQLNVSGGGVPKQPVDRVEVDWTGVVGDRQGNRQHHGRPWQALCLWSTEVIDGFAAAGHPLRAGAAGENVTVSGLDWAAITPGVVLEVGAVRCEVSSYAIPCSKNAGWFLDGAYDAMHHRAGPVSRVYATVLTPGAIATGDPVTLTR
jgi:MOSC domain-containing protein YiiM